jgi:hypothetical protein
LAGNPSPRAETRGGRQRHLSSNFVGFLASAATWFQHSTLSAQTSNANGNYAFGVTGIRLNVTAGSSTGQTTMTLVQAG